MQAEIIEFASEEPKTPFAPTWNHFLLEAQVDDVDFEAIAKFVLSKEDWILSLPENTNKDPSAYTGAKGVTTRFSSYNFFESFAPECEEIDKLWKRVYEVYIGLLEYKNVPRTNVYFKSWCNILRTGETLRPHIHTTSKWSYLSAHITVKANGSSTVYVNPVNQINDPEEYNRPNKQGKMTVFESCIPHYTTEDISDEPRITIAMDFLVEKHVLLLDNKYIIPFDIVEQNDLVIQR
jgi:hypothetical protein